MVVLLLREESAEKVKKESKQTGWLKEDIECDAIHM
jgi:hypothetical protein